MYRSCVTLISLLWPLSSLTWFYTKGQVVAGCSSYRFMNAFVNTVCTTLYWAECTHGYTLCLKVGCMSNSEFRRALVFVFLLSLPRTQTICVHYMYILYKISRQHMHSFMERGPWKHDPTVLSSMRFSIKPLTSRYNSGVTNIYHSLITHSSSDA